MSTLISNAAEFTVGSIEQTDTVCHDLRLLGLGC